MQFIEVTETYYKEPQKRLINVANISHIYRVREDNPESKTFIVLFSFTKEKRDPAEVDYIVANETYEQISYLIEQACMSEGGKVWRL